MVAGRLDGGVHLRELHVLGVRQHQRDLMERALAWFDQYVKG
jgi:hypothetical protein